MLNLFFFSPLIYKYIKSGKITVLNICYVDAPVKFVAPEPMSNVLWKKGEVTRVIYLHELLWLIALWLDAENYNIDARVPDLCYINFSSLAH